MATESLIEFDNVEAGYGSLTILQKASLSVREGLITLLTGANGAGKSTALKALFGVIRATSGDIRLGGKSIVGHSPRNMLDLGMAYVPQDRSLFPGLSVYQNLELGGIMLPRKQIRARIEEVLERFPRLRERANSQACTLSGGERKQLEIARALLLRPSILLIDEPSIGLSPKIVGEVFDLLGKLAADGKTILLVEQNVRSALKVAHHVYGMEMGRILIDMPADGVMDDPAFTRLLLGGHVPEAA